MGYVGMSGTLHDGSDGCHLIGDDCPNDCYELACHHAVGATPEERAEDLAQTAQGDGVPLAVEVCDHNVDAFDFTYGNG